jgi:hypothetical protein
MSALRSLTGVTSITGEFTTKQEVVRRQAANASNRDFQRFMAYFQMQGFTGNVTFGMTQGNIRTVTAEDSIEISGDL